MDVILNLLLGGIAVFISAYLVPGVFVDNILVAIVVSVVLGILNTLLKPILIVLTLPVNIITLGLFTLVINTALILLAGLFIPGFVVIGFLPALLFGILLGLVNFFLSTLSK